jgi:hypothetical protein
MPKEMGMSKEMSTPNGRGGHLYMQTNEVKNAVVHYHRSANGTLTEVERVATSGAGSGVFKPISGQDSAPNSFEGAGSVILSPDRRFLFATNGGDNSVSSFTVGNDGKLTLLDTKPTGNAVEGRSGTAKSLAYEASRGILYVLHSFGPDHLRLMSVGGDGKLTPRMERYTANTATKLNRVPTMSVMSPDGKFLLVGTTFDLPIAISGMYPDGSPILWVQGPDGKYKVVASNAPDPDGLVVFRINSDGTLSGPSFHDGGAGSPFYIAFLHNRPDTFVIGYAVGDGVAMGHIDEDGRIGIGPLEPIDTSNGNPQNCAGLQCRRMTARSTARISVTATSAAFASTAAKSGSPRIPRARRCGAMARPGGYAATSPAARATTGSRLTAHFCIRSTGMPRDLWATPPNLMAL